MQLEFPLQALQASCRVSLQNGAEQELRDNQKNTKEFRITSQWIQLHSVRHVWKFLSRLQHLNITLAPMQKQMCFPHGFGRSGSAAEQPTDRWSQRSLFILHYRTSTVLFGVWSKEQHLFFMMLQSHTLTYFNIMATPLHSALADLHQVHQVLLVRHSVCPSFTHLAVVKVKELHQPEPKSV